MLAGIDRQHRRSNELGCAIVSQQSRPLSSTVNRTPAIGGTVTSLHRGLEGHRTSRDRTAFSLAAFRERPNCRPFIGPPTLGDISGPRARIGHG